MPARLELYLESLRLDRWPRSLAVIPGTIAVFILSPGLLNQIHWGGFLFKLITTFLLTWSISTANYIVNEITDAPFDRHHPQKKNRPLIHNQISKTTLMAMWVILVGMSIALALVLFNRHFLFSLLALLAAGILYNVPPIRLKDIPLLDSTAESANNPIRFLIGWYTVETAFPPVLVLVSWWCFGNFLMIGKRIAEKKFLTEQESASYRISLKKSSFTVLMSFMAVNAFIFLLTFSLFSIQFKFYSFLFSLPFILIYLAMFTKKSLRDREGAEEPEKLLRNPHFLVYTIFLVILFILAYILK